MKALKVLHVYRTYFPETKGGVQEAIRQISLAGRPLGVESSIFTLAHDPLPADLYPPEGHVLRARSWMEIASCDFGGLAALRRCRAAARECDVLHLHYPWPFADMMLPFIRPTGQPLVVTYHSDVVRQALLDKLYSPLRRYLLDSAARVVATSPPYAESSPVLQAYRKKMSIIPLCLEALAPSDEVKTRESHWRQEVGEEFFLFVGVLRYYKGLRFLLTAAAEVDTPIVIVGDGPERDWLAAQAASLPPGRVRFLGALPDEDKLALFNLCRAFVFPSHLRSEAFGVSLLEAARAGKPMISCAMGSGTSWVNLDGVTGCVVPPADPLALARAMRHLASDVGLCKHLGQGARERWLSLFLPEAVGRAYRQVYDQVLEAT